MRLVLLVIALLLAGPAYAQLLVNQPKAPVIVAPPAPAPRAMLARDIAVLQVLDKVSARTTRLRVPVGSSAAFGLMFVTVRSCQVAPPSEPPESAAFLEVSEVNLGRSAPADGQPSVTQTQPERLLFTGWMFASSPALSALEHPTYDLMVMSCEARSTSTAEQAASGEEGAALAPATPATGGTIKPSVLESTAEPAPQD